MPFIVQRIQQSYSFTYDIFVSNFYEICGHNEKSELTTLYLCNLLSETVRHEK